MTTADLRKWLFVNLLFLYLNILNSTLSASINATHHKIVYLMHSGNFIEAIEAYQDMRQQTQTHDLELLQEISTHLLYRGLRSKDSEVQLLTLFGAGISGSERLLPLLEEATYFQNPQIQLLALNFLSRYQDDFADTLINHALNSDYPIVRIEALYHLANLNHPNTLGQVEALMTKIPQELHLVFPPIIAMINSPNATLAMRKFFSHPETDVRIVSILSIVEKKRDEFLPQIRRLAKQHSIPQQEACAFALGALQDHESSDILNQFCKSNLWNVKLAALKAKSLLEDQACSECFKDIVSDKNLFAITLLGELEKEPEVLVSLTHDSNLQVRINAGLALLHMRRGECLPILSEVLIQNPKDLALQKIYSPGKTLYHWKAVSSSALTQPSQKALSSQYRKELLKECLELPEKNLLYLGNLILTSYQNELTPTFISLLETKPTPQIIAFLKKFQQQPGSPLNRLYCSLALYRLKEPGNYDNILKEWLVDQAYQEQIRFTALIKPDPNSLPQAFQLSPQEKSQFLIEIYETFAREQNEEGLDLLVEALHQGNPKNRFALAGLIIRASQ